MRVDQFQSLALRLQILWHATRQPAPAPGQPACHGWGYRQCRWGLSVANLELPRVEPVLVDGFQREELGGSSAAHLFHRYTRVQALRTALLPQLLRATPPAQPQSSLFPAPFQSRRCRSSRVALGCTRRTKVRRSHEQPRSFVFAGWAKGQTWHQRPCLWRRRKTTASSASR